MILKLSRRNLIYFLAKLERGDSSVCLIQEDGTYIVVEQDDIHYLDRKPGVFSDDTQDMMNEIERKLKYA